MPDATELLARAVARQPVADVPSGRALLREEVYARIHDWIVECVLPPETRLRDLEIAEALDVSRTPVREAIRRLQDEGLVVAEAHRWTKVAPLDAGLADRVYPIVWTNERLAVSLSGRWDAERIAALRAANDRLAVALANREALKASEADTDFHRQVIEAANNPELTAIIKDLKMRLRRVEIAYFGGTATADRSVMEHERVIAALEAGDLDAAASAIEDNWRAPLARLHERLADGTFATPGCG